MSFTATKKEWSEIYIIFRLLSEATISRFVSKEEAYKQAPVALLQREEHDGTRQYIIEEEYIHMVGETMDKRVSRATFKECAAQILAAMKASSDEKVASTDYIESFLDEVEIFNLEAKTEDRTDFYIAFYHVDAPLMGVSSRSKIGKLYPLLDGGRSANLKFELVGNKFSVPTVQNINALTGENGGVLARIQQIQLLGGALKYADVADRVFRSNLSMIDLHFPRLLAEMVRLMQLTGIVRVNELTKELIALNPLKINNELIQKHNFYEHKIKDFLLTVALGMRPAKIYRGEETAIDAFLLLNGDGTLQFYEKNEADHFKDFLFNNTRLEHGTTEKDKYGFLEKENGVYYFKLNAKLGLTKR